VLGGYPDVRESVAVLREEEPGEPRLVAYYVVPDGQKHAPQTNELRGYLKERLPDYMVPSAFVMLDAMPLTPSGKVDRRALPAPDPSGFRAENAYAEPRTPAEEALAVIWEEVLGLERVGIHDHFFELGGQSLRATRVISRVHDVFGVELPLLSIFEEPTLSGLADRLEEVRQSHSAPPISLPKMNNVEELRL
jgi:acyl carrier protein